MYKSGVYRSCECRSLCVLEACLCNVITVWCYGPLPVEEFTGSHGYSYFYACTVSSCRLDI